MRYEQYCPIAKAAEVVGERWTLLVLRELLAGATHYAELQRGLGRISSSVLSARLKTLIEHGIITRVARDSKQGWEYRLTEAGEDLAPVLETVAVWGQHWVRSRMTRDELDVELLMLQVQRYFDGRAFPQKHAVVGFVFSDLHGSERRWWLLLDEGKTELCVQRPGRSDDVTLTCGRRTLAEVFTGETTVQVARGTRRLEVRGPSRLVRNVHHWLRASPLADTLRTSSG